VLPVPYVRLLFQLNSFLLTTLSCVLKNYGLPQQLSLLFNGLPELRFARKNECASEKNYYILEATDECDECVLSDTTVSFSATRTEQVADRSGWMALHALDVKQALRSVDIQDGESTAVVTIRTYQSRVMCQVYTQVRNWIFTVFVLVSK